MDNRHNPCLLDASTPIEEVVMAGGRAGGQGGRGQEQEQEQGAGHIGTNLQEVL